jgi:hypothetical protein
LKSLARFRDALKCARQVTVGRELVLRLFSRGDRFAPSAAGHGPIRRFSKADAADGALSVTRGCKRTFATAIYDGEAFDILASAERCKILEFRTAQPIREHERNSCEMTLHDI